MTYSLNENLVDQDGCSWSSLNNWFFLGILEGCGCGTSEEIARKAVEVLKFFGKTDRTESFWDLEGESYEILAHWIDSKGLIEHGYTIGNSWLSPEGENVLKVIQDREALEKEWEENLIK